MIDFAACPLTGIATTTVLPWIPQKPTAQAWPLTGIAMFYAGITQCAKGPPDLEVLLLHT